MSSKPFELPIEKLPVIELKGSYSQIGQQFGEACRSQIHDLYKVRMSAALEHAAERGRTFTEEQALDLLKSCTPIIKDFDKNTYEETRGIAQGADLNIEQILMLQGLTDYRDVLSWGKIADGFGCTSMIVSRERSENGKLILAQNWDLGTTNMPYVCFVIRHPDDAPSSYNLTVAGGLSLIGLNSEGIAIGTNNIKSTDSKPGVHYLNLIHKAMQLSTHEQVKDMITNATRSGAHYFLFGDKKGEYSGLECTATKHAEITSKDGIVTHCNHILTSELKSLEAEDMGESTCHRQLRVDELVKNGFLSVNKIKQILSDRDGDELSICRHSDDAGISTNASIIIEPEAGLIHACRSQPHLGEWKTFKVF
ncbi:MAG: C45 family peptidase [Lentisphaerales bacterium]|nr:C45 family peptidase [Lentisphaerales bacterium]